MIKYSDHRRNHVIMPGREKDLTIPNPLMIG